MPFDQYFVNYNGKFYELDELKKSKWGILKGDKFFELENNKLLDLKKVKENLVKTSNCIYRKAEKVILVDKNFVFVPKNVLVLKLDDKLLFFTYKKYDLIFFDKNSDKLYLIKNSYERPYYKGIQEIGERLLHIYEQSQKLKVKIYDLQNLKEQQKIIFYSSNKFGMELPLKIKFSMLPNDVNLSIFDIWKLKERFLEDDFLDKFKSMNFFIDNYLNLDELKIINLNKVKLVIANKKLDLKLIEFNNIKIKAFVLDKEQLNDLLKGNYKIIYDNSYIGDLMNKIFELSNKKLYLIDKKLSLIPVEKDKKGNIFLCQLTIENKEILKFYIKKGDKK